MSYELHKLAEGFIITSDEKPKNGDIVISKINYRKFLFEKGDIIDDISHKIIAQQDQINFSALSEKDQKEIGWFDIQKHTDEIFPLLDETNDNTGEIHKENLDLLSHRRTYKAGFQKALELLSDRKFTEKDIKMAYRNGWSNREESKTENPPYFHNDSSWGENGLNNFIQSLSQQSWPIECIEENGKIKITKIL